MANQVNPDSLPSSPSASTPKVRKRRWIAWLVFFVVLFGALFLHRCPSPPETLPEPETEIIPPKNIPESVIESTFQTTIPLNSNAKNSSTKEKSDTVRKSNDSLWVVAAPWGGRHFDSVTVTLSCRENCVALYSLEDSIHLLTYDAPLVFRRNTRLWLSGLSVNGSQLLPFKLEYVIEKNKGQCKKGSMPIRMGAKESCVDEYEWPNREGQIPRAMVSHAEAKDSCLSLGKRLCTESEWREACQGPEKARYPYGNHYDGRYCPAQQAEPMRSGRTPACRSYYGIYDMTGNLWEWTGTPHATHEDFFLVTGGNWETAEKATCAQSKFSFYPQNRYPGVGFRCCEDGK